MSEFDGLKALLVEDEGPVALLIEDMLLDLGCEIAASAANVESACQLARTVAIDFAVVDLNLNGASAAPVAQFLRERRIPFVFSTGYGRSGVPAGYESWPTLAKPFLPANLQEAIRFYWAKDSSMLVPVGHYATAEVGPVAMAKEFQARRRWNGRPSISTAFRLAPSFRSN